MNYSPGAGVLITLLALCLIFWPKIRKLFRKKQTQVRQESKLDD